MRRGGGPNSSLFGPSYNNVESENDKLVDQLSTKVQALKSLSIEIGHEVKLHNTLLDGMGEEFDSTGSFLSQTMKKLTMLTKKGHHNVICYLLLFCLIFFIITWIIVRFY